MNTNNLITGKSYTADLISKNILHEFVNIHRTGNIYDATEEDISTIKFIRANFFEISAIYIHPDFEIYDINKAIEIIERDCSLINFSELYIGTKDDKDKELRYDKLYLHPDMNLIINFRDETFNICFFYEPTIENTKKVHAYINSFPKIEKEIIEQPHMIYIMRKIHTGFDYYPVPFEMSYEVDLEKCYNDDFFSFHQKVCKCIVSKENGLIVMNGPPRTGKTSYIQHLTSVFKDRKFYLLSVSNALKMHDQGLVDFLHTIKESIIVIEDGEALLMEQKPRSPIVSFLLDELDGWMSKIQKNLYICTFNTDMKNIDPAIKAAGRLKASYTFGPLNKSKAQFFDPDVTKDTILGELFHSNENSIDNRKEIGFSK